METHLSVASEANMVLHFWKQQQPHNNWNYGTIDCNYRNYFHLQWHWVIAENRMDGVGGYA